MNKFEQKIISPEDYIIKSAVIVASENAFPLEVWDRYLNTGEINFEEKIKKATVVCKDLHEYRVALETILKNKPELVNETLSHENAHSNKSEQLGYGHESYKLIVLRDFNGELFIQPSFLPGKEIENKEDRAAVAKAPEEYDSYLSDIDKKNL